MRQHVGLLTSALVLALAAAAYAGGSAGAPPKAGGHGQAPGVPVETSAVIARPVQASRTFVGSVEPSRRSLVGSEFAGLVTEILVREGDRVAAGQPLARLRTKLVELRLDAARAELKLRQERLRELENGSRPEEIRQAQARVTQLDAELELRAWRLEASQRLFTQKTISEDELRDARLAMRAAELLRDAAKAALDLVEAGPREEEIAQARAQVEIQDAAIATLEEEKERYVIGAPFAGWVVEERTEVGQWLQAGAPVVDMVHLDEVDVVVPVAEDVASRVRAGAPVRVRVAAVGERVFAAQVHRVVPQADLRGRTFPVRIRLANELADGEPLLKAGMFAEATIGVGDESTGLFVPKDALVLGGPQPMVWTVDPATSMARPVPVELGIAIEDLVQIRAPLEPGSPVVTRGNERLFPPMMPVHVLGEGVDR